MYRVSDLYREHGKALSLEIIAGKEGLQHKIKVPEVHRPGLALTGYLKHHASKRILVFGKVEMEYLRDLTASIRHKLIKDLLQLPTPAVIVARQYKPTLELISVCNEMDIPLFRTRMTTMELMNKTH
ncbi:MAG: hypothetical protein NTY13_03725 [Chlamydiae bacterium]|nr:hypothetical protein [Chlamydiota bacterium]